MDVFDLSSQEEFSPLKPLTKRARRVLTPTQDQSLTASTPTDENDNCRQSQTDSKNSGSSRTQHSEKQDSDGALMLAECSDCDVSVSSFKEACDSDRQTEDAKRPIYVYSQELIRRCDAMPKIINRV